MPGRNKNHQEESTMKMNDIKAKANEMGIKSSRMAKTELIRAIQEREGHSACFKTAMAHCSQSECCWRQDCLS